MRWYCVGHNRRLEVNYFLCKQARSGPRDSIPTSGRQILKRCKLESGLPLSKDVILLKSGTVEPEPPPSKTFLPAGASKRSYEQASSKSQKHWFDRGCDLTASACCELQSARLRRFEADARG